MLSLQDLRHGLQGLDAVFRVLDELWPDLAVRRLVEKSELETLWLHGRLLLKPANILLFLAGSIVLRRLDRSQFLNLLFLVPRSLERIPIVLRLIVNDLRHFQRKCLLVLFLALG